MTANCPRVRCVRCPTCAAHRYNRCTSAGRPVDWHHTDRHNLADGPTKGRPRRPIPAEVPGWIAEGVTMREIERRTGIPRSTLWRHGYAPAPSG